MAELVYDPETGKMISKYDLFIKNKLAKQALGKEITSGGILDESGDITEEIKDESGDIPLGMVESGQMSQDDFLKSSYQKGGANYGSKMPEKEESNMYGGSLAAAGKTALGGGNILQTVGSGLTAAPNPFAQGAGYALLALNKVNEDKFANEMTKYRQQVAALNQRRADIDRGIELYKNIKV